MACYYSKNPINVQVVTTGTFNTTEIQVYTETQAGSNVFNSLGTFRFISDANSEVNQDIASVLDAYCLKLLQTSVPNNEGTIDELPLHSIGWYISSRHYDSGTWTSWVDQETNYVLYGGVGYEEVTSGLLELTSRFLQTNDYDFTTKINDPAVYALIETPGTYNWEIEHEEYQGSYNGGSDGIITTTNNWSVVKFPISIPEDNYKTTVRLNLDGPIIECHLINDTYPYEQIEEFVFLSLRNGWRTLSCTANLTSILEVSQNTYEKQQQFEYYNANNIATTEVWRTVGMKRFKTATGFLPEQMIDQLLQDFALSPKKFKWDSDLEKFIPVVVSTKSVEYLNSTKQGLRSFSFEYRPAFENNMPSRL